MAVTFVRWGGVTGYLKTDFNMGRGRRRNGKRYGFRRAVWDAAFGYVSGFPKRDILYFVLTRSLSCKVCEFTLRREGVQFDHGLPVSRVIRPVTPTESGENTHE